MLNALRHQRNLHDLAFKPIEEGDECSTPYGIRGIFTIAKQSYFSELDVLNALRHQRNLHVYENAFRRYNLDVLNALRHQRNLHLWRYGIAKTWY